MLRFLLSSATQLKSLLVLFVGLLGTQACFGQQNSFEASSIEMVYKAELDVAPQKSAKYFFQNGMPVGSRGLTLGDPQEWLTLVTKLSGTSKGEKVRITPADFHGDEDAMRIQWRGCCDMGVVAIYGHPTDLTDYQKGFALAFDFQLNAKPTQSVLVGMDCGYPCVGQYDIKKLLQSDISDAKSSLLIPLHCLRGTAFDFGNVQGVFRVTTSGELDITLANVRLEPVGDKKSPCP